MRLVVPILAVAMAIPGCPDKAPVPPTLPTNVPATPCALLCQHLADLNCDAARPTPKGADCVDVCENAAAQDIDLTCGGKATAAADCDAAMTCK